jgi:hypothetical protein
MKGERTLNLSILTSGLDELCGLFFGVDGFPSVSPCFKAFRVTFVASHCTSPPLDGG